MIGERPLNALMESLADVRKAKVKEAYEKATVKVKAGSGGPPKPSVSAKEPPKTKSNPKQTAVEEASASVVDVEDGSKVPSKKLPARLMVCTRSFLFTLLNLTKAANRRRKGEDLRLQTTSRLVVVLAQCPRQLHPLLRR